MCACACACACACVCVFIQLAVPLGVSKSAWRVTVRQLESLIRLSEAMARLHCEDMVHPKHVREAFRLLNRSIIRVETPDIEFSEPDKPVLENGDGEAGERRVADRLRAGLRGGSRTQDWWSVSLFHETRIN